MERLFNIFVAFAERDPGTWQGRHWGWYCGPWSVGWRESSGKGEFSLSQWGCKEDFSLIYRAYFLKKTISSLEMTSRSALVLGHEVPQVTLLGSRGGGPTASYMWLTWHLWSRTASRSAIRVRRGVWLLICHITRATRMFADVNIFTFSSSHAVKPTRILLKTKWMCLI